MKWLTTTADEHVLCDDRGRHTGYKIRRDPVRRWCEEQHSEGRKSA